MGNKKTLLILILVFSALLVGASVLYTQLGKGRAPDQLATQETPSPEDSGKENQPVSAPDFVIYDQDGKAVQLSNFIGKPIVLNFWASWCGPCQMEMPDFDEKYKALGNDIHFLMVNMTDGSRETVAIASGFISDKGYTFPVFYDTDSQAAYAYSVYSLPTTYFISAEGYLVAQATGAISGDTLQQGIDMIYQP